jgi:hypothetical protein
LQNLLKEEGIYSQVNGSLVGDVEYSLALTNARLQSKKKLVEANMKDEEILQLARNDELSFLGSFLKVIEDGNGEPVTSRHLCRRCCLAVNPVYVPAGMDAEEFALGALTFLETSFVGKTKHPLVPRLPLLRAEKEENDIRKRAYVKAYEWKLSDILDTLAYLDYVFLSNSGDLKWLQREAFGPVQLLDAESEAALFLKGKFRAPSTKKKTPVVSRKKTKTQTVGPDNPMEGSSATYSQGPGEEGGGTPTMVDTIKEAVAKESLNIHYPSASNQNGDDFA